MLGIDITEWKEQTNIPSYLREVLPLFEKLDINSIQEEYNRLVNHSK
jgi:hypothetical protein